MISDVKWRCCLSVTSFYSVTRQHVDYVQDVMFILVIHCSLYRPFPVSTTGCSSSSLRSWESVSLQWRGSRPCCAALCLWSSASGCWCSPAAVHSSPSIPPPGWSPQCSTWFRRSCSWLQNKLIKELFVSTFFNFWNWMISWYHVALVTSHSTKFGEPPNLLIWQMHTYIDWYRRTSSVSGIHQYTEYQHSCILSFVCMYY